MRTGNNFLGKSVWMSSRTNVNPAAWNISRKWSTDLSTVSVDVIHKWAQSAYRVMLQSETSSTKPLSVQFSLTTITPFSDSAALHRRRNSIKSVSVK